MSDRFVQAHLVDASHAFVVPGTARLFSPAPEGETIDLYDDFWRALLADGSLALGERQPAAAPPSDPIPDPTTEPTP